MTALFSLRGIKRHYGGRLALDIPHLDIPAGRLLGVCGPNGSGKSTLLRLLAMLESPDSGEVLFEGAPTGDLRTVRRQVTLLLQEPYLLSRSVAENVAYGLSVRGIRDEERVRASLLAVGLDPDLFGERRRNELSGGEAQRVALAARLAIRPQVLLMDEPTASVDEESAGRIALAARTACEQGTTVVVVSHDREWLDALADDQLRLKAGRIVA